MILTSKGRYAVMAMLQIAQSHQDAPINLFNISADQNISHNYLQQLFIKLKHHKLITSIRGPNGGYKLNHNPSDISIYSIIAAVEDDIKVPKCGDNKKCISSKAKCATHHLWSGLENNVISYLNNFTLADLITKEKIYLDYNATSPINPVVLNKMHNALTYACNPSSLHWHGRRAKALIENARLEIAEALGITMGVDSYQITFTSSGTEANNLLLHNFSGKNILISTTEHLSILNTAKEYGNPILINVDGNGQIDMNHFKKCINLAEPGSLVSIIMANNETGVIQQNMHEMISLAQEKGLFIHSDMVQAFGKIPVLLNNLDFATISSHKIGGPIGAAALVHKTKFPIKSQILGGGQERGARSGTENVSAIVGFGASASLNYPASHIAVLRDYMEKQIHKICPEAIFYGGNTTRLPNTSMIFMPNIDAQRQLIQFDLQNISLSSGSACSSGKIKISHTLLAMGVNEEAAKCSIRVSLGESTTKEEIEKFVEAWKKIWNS